MPRPLSTFVFVTLLGVVATAARSEMLASSSFDSSPKPADPRFVLNADSTLTARYNSFLDTDKLLFPLARPLTSDESFTVTTRFKILSAGFSAPSDQLGQISFGLVNLVTTGNDRSGSPTTNGDTFDSVTLDYFPNVTPFFASPTLSPTVFATAPTAGSPAFDVIYSVFGEQSALSAAGEAPLPLDTFLTSHLAYDAAVHRVTLSLATDAGSLLINAEGGADGNNTTIQLQLPETADFRMDAYALTLWKDAWAFGVPSVQADVVFDSFAVTAVPEPSTLILLALAAPLVARRRR